MIMPRSTAPDARHGAAGIYRGSRSYAFPTDNRGHLALPTLAAVDKATGPDDKLAIAGQLADVIQIQAETAAHAGSTGRLADLLFRCWQVLDALDEIIDGVTDVAGPDEAASALKPHQQPLATVLATLHGALSQLATLPLAAGDEDAARTAFRFRQLDIGAGALAAKAGLFWPPLPAAAGPAAPSRLVGGLDVVA